jgi:hypothetical protein
VTTFHSKMKLKATLCLYIHLQIELGRRLNEGQVCQSNWHRLFFIVFSFWLCCIWTNIHLKCIQLYALKVTGIVMVRPEMQGMQVCLLFFCDSLFIGFWWKTVFKCDSRKTIIFAKKSALQMLFFLVMIKYFMLLWP